MMDDTIKIVCPGAEIPDAKKKAEPALEDLGDYKLLYDEAMVSAVHWIRSTGCTYAGLVYSFCAKVYPLLLCVCGYVTPHLSPLPLCGLDRTGARGKARVGEGPEETAAHRQPMEVKSRIAQGALLESIVYKTETEN